MGEGLDHSGEETAGKSSKTITTLGNKKGVAQRGGADRGRTVKVSHQNPAGGTRTKRKKNTESWVETEAAMEGIFIEHANRTLNPNRNAMLGTV